jgi:hypothetical protein
MYGDGFTGPHLFADLSIVLRIVLELDTTGPKEVCVGWKRCRLEW